MTPVSGRGRALGVNLAYFTTAQGGHSTSTSDCEVWCEVWGNAEVQDNN